MLVLRLIKYLLNQCCNSGFQMNFVSKLESIDTYSQLVYADSFSLHIASGKIVINVVCLAFSSGYKLYTRQNCIINYKSRGAVSALYQQYARSVKQYFLVYGLIISYDRFFSYNFTFKLKFGTISHIQYKINPKMR